PITGGRENAGVSRDRTLSTAVENLPPPVIHLYIQPSSGQRMHRSTEPSSPEVVDARHAAALQNRDGLGRRLGGSGRRRATTLRSPAFRNDTRWQRKTEPMEALQYAATWGHRGRALDRQPRHRDPRGESRGDDLSLQG